MSIPGFRRDPIREELRRLNRESVRLGHTARRLVEESAHRSSQHGRLSGQPSVLETEQRAPRLRVESRLAKRRVLLALAMAVLLALALYFLVSGNSV